jgi:hypothetical protein
VEICIVKRKLVSVLGVVLMLFAAASALPSALSSARAADDAKPVLTVSLNSYDGLLKDAAYVGKVVGVEMLDKKIEEAVAGLAGGLEGFDKSKPMGFVITSDGASFSGMGFIPVTDVAKLLKAVADTIPSEDAEDGVKKLTPPRGEPAFLKAKGGWAFIARDAAALAKLPDDPLKLLGGIEKDYDAAVRVHLQNIPDLYRQLVIGGIETGVKASLRQNPDESAEEFAARKKTLQAQVDNIVAVINDMDQITLGWNVDATGKKLVLDIGSTVVADSKTAKRMAAQFKDLKTDFAGFYRDDAVLSINGVGKMAEEDVKQTASMIGDLRKQLLDQLDKSADFENDAQKAKVKELAGKLFDVMDGMIKGGKFDAGLAILGEGPFTLAYGMHVPDSAAADKALRDVVKLADSEGLLDKVEFDAEKSADITFHRISPKLGDKAEQVSKVLGENPKLNIGIAKNSVYLSLGAEADGVKTLQGLIAKSKTEADKPALPMRMSIALGPIVKFAAKHDPFNPIIAGLGDSLAGGQDHIRITGRPIPNGEIVRIEFEEGVVKSIGTAVRSVLALFGGGGFGGGAP